MFSLCVLLASGMCACDDEVSTPFSLAGGAHFIVSASAESAGAAATSTLRITISGPEISENIVMVADNPFNYGWSWEGTVQNIPAGDDRVFLAEWLDTTGTVTARGEVSGVTIPENEIVQVMLTMTELVARDPAELFTPVIRSIVVSSFRVAPNESIQMKVFAETDNLTHPMSYKWSVDGGVLSNSTSDQAEWTATNLPVPSEYNVTIKVTEEDFFQAFVTSTFVVHVVDPSLVHQGDAAINIEMNFAPAILWQGVEKNPVPVGEWVRLRNYISESSSDYDFLTYQWSADCDGEFSDSQIAQPQFRLNSLTGDSCTLTLVVSDGAHESIGRIKVSTGSGVEPAEAPLNCFDALTFVDLALEQAVRETIAKPFGPIYYADVAGLTNLVADSREIADISGIECLNQLKSLQLSSNHITDLSPLSGLTQLEMLAVSNNEISDLNPLRKMIHLNELKMDFNRISDLGPLSVLTGLNNVTVSANELNDISTLLTARWVSEGDVIHLADNPLICEDAQTPAVLNYLHDLNITTDEVCDSAP